MLIVQPGCRDRGDEELRKKGMRERDQRDCFRGKKRREEGRTNLRSVRLRSSCERASDRAIERENKNTSATRSEDSREGIVDSPFAILSVYGLSCLKAGSNSSSNSFPQILSPPVPSPKGSPVWSIWIERENMKECQLREGRRMVAFEREDATKQE